MVIFFLFLSKLFVHQTLSLHVVTVHSSSSSSSSSSSHLSLSLSLSLSCCSHLQSMATTAVLFHLLSLSD
ncbi:hypothetical protein RchiOBHm_Chr7g0241231 [Rosa chinensis]|uniref:Uncharacterized protein n=1 Tax=Rosa chinensis TaxID=74649 RepID=A0A2P6PI77_ROSCH|nr:hypothetical protein RchiOBHm_Chr7g0241231 [Rosa chinensis]